MERTELTTTVASVERVLAAVEHNGIEHVYSPQGNYPCGGCRTYQVAVREALRILRSLEYDGAEDRVRQEAKD